MKYASSKIMTNPQINVKIYKVNGRYTFSPLGNVIYIIIKITADKKEVIYNERCLCKDGACD